MLRVFLVIDDYNELIYLQSLLKKLGLDVEGVQNQKKYADMSLGFNPHILIASAKGKKVDGLQLTQSLYRKRGLPKVVILKTPDQHVKSEELREAGVDEVLDSPVNPRKLILTMANLGGVDETALLEKYAKIKGQFNNGTDHDPNNFISSYDDNGQPIENVHQIRQNIEAATQTSGPAAPDDSNAPMSESPQFPLRKKGQKDAGVAPEAVDPNDPEVMALSEDGEGEPLVKSEREETYESWAKKVGPLEPKHFTRDRILDFNKKIRAWPQVEDIDQIEDERKTFVKALFRSARRK